MKVWKMYVIILANLLATGLFWPAPSFAQDPLICSTPDLTIPDVGAGSGAVTDTLTITTTGLITDLNVSILANYDYVGDLSFTLEHVDTGSSATLMDRPGVPASTFGCDRDNINATLDDEGATPVEEECGEPVAVSGVFTPNNPLTVFDGENIAGTWQLVVADNAPLNQGTLAQWCLLPSPQTDLAITKSADNTTPNENDPLIYIVSVNNRGPDEASGVVISDTLPVSLTFVSANPSQGAYDDGSGLWEVGSLAASESATLTLKATVNPGTVGQAITNTATLSASDQIEFPAGNNTASAGIQVAVADLRLNKQANRSIVRENDTVRYTITVANNGPDEATGLVITDTWPLSLTLVASSATQGDFDSLSGIWMVGALPDSQAVTLILIGTVNGGLAGQTITNTAAISAATQFDPDETNNRAEAVLQVSSADLAVTKVASAGQPKENDLIFYTVTVNNNGPEGATGLLISDTLPLSLTLAMSDTSQGNYNAQSGIWNVGKLLASQSATLTLMTSVLTGTAGQTITNTALVFAVDQDDANPENNLSTAAITISNAELALNKTVDITRPTEGDTIAYTVTVNNNGSDDATGVIIGEALPLSVTLVASDTSQGSYEVAAGAWEVGNVAAGAAATLTLTATVEAGSAGQTLTNTAAISASGQSDADLTNNSASAAIFVTSADLLVSKTVSATRLDESDPLTYTITVANNGPDAATGVVISDMLPVSLTLVASSTSQGSYNDNTGAWQIGTLGITDTATLILQTVVKPGTAGQTIVNVAEIGAAKQVDPDDTNNTGTAAITVTNAELALSKVVGNSTPTEGDSVIYTVTVSNNGPEPATGVIISDTLPLSLTLVTSNTSQGGYDGGSGGWNVGSLSASESATLTLEALVEAGTVGQTITNTAKIGASDVGDANSANNVAEAAITVIGADLVISKSAAPDPADAGEPLTYTITISNSGPLTATGVVMADTLPAGLNFVSVSPSPPCAELGGTITCTLGALNSGAAKTVTVVVTTSLTGTVTNTVSVAAVEADPNPANNIASVETSVGTVGSERLYLPIVIKEE
ncbi:MAG: proprotein convertase P-domain-containing protein [Anaerolineae bacterium]